uniref:SHSP domain-containing protein n=1 Tax=Salix viminalis TaxID=40686 RepID=A0A6N2NGA9_SALVM
MAASIALRRGTASPLLSKLINPVRSVSAFRSFNTDSQSQVTTTGGNSLTMVAVSSSAALLVVALLAVAMLLQVSSQMRSIHFPNKESEQGPEPNGPVPGQPFPPASRGAGALLPRRGYDVKEDENSLYIFMDMPGLSKEDVKVTVEQNTLVINGEESKEGDESGRRYSSRLELPSNQFMLDEIKNGVLKLEVPKVKEEVEKNVHEVKTHY